MEKSWVWLPRNSSEYAEGAKSFVNASVKALGYPTELFCPCIDCRNVSHQSVDAILDHLVIRGMDHKYKRKKLWILHGDSREDQKDYGEVPGLDAYELFRTAYDVDEDSPQSPKPSGSQFQNGTTTEDSEFYKKLNEAETPLYSTCQNYTKVTAIMGLYRIKVKSGMSENYFDQLLAMVHDMLPDDNVLPKSTDEIKRFLKVFGFGYEVIHACKNDCILYRKQYEKVETCPRCGSSRWETDKHSGSVKKGVAAKVLRYFPIKERFQRMFRSRRVAEELRWHHGNASEDGTMRHPVDSITWAQVNVNWPEFAGEPRNLRLGISTDGMNPFSIQNTKYSTWPVFLVNYNMSPMQCMKAENIMLTMLIPGPTAPSNNIDVYLQPLVDDLKDLWSEGIEVFDSYMNEKFTLKALLLWSISDYPALGTLSGCKVKGKQACVVCGKDTPHRWLKFSRKYVYLGNRKRLRPGHPYRRRKGWFDNTVENENARRIQTGAEIYEAVKNFRNDFGKPLSRDSKRKRAESCEDDVVSEEEYEEDTDQWRWKKRSIFFDLPYWKDLPVRHNIDVMHVEKNLSDAILSILMNNAKSKDGVKARKDLEDMGIRRNLHTQIRGKRTYLPPAAYWLSKEEKKRFCKRLSKFRGPDGYCANIANCISLEPPAISGMKSHDHHVLIQNLLPVALRGLLPKGPRVAITRLCNYFNRLCQRVIDPEKLISLESEFVETMCQMERFFPPALFDIMFHLPLHLGREARLGGPVHFRWMYPFERFMKALKAYVKNFARPEACMAEGYLAEECLAFCLEFLKNALPIQEAINRNEDAASDEHILEGRPLQKPKEVTLSDKERDIAHRYVLMNTAILDPYIEMHLEELQATDVRCARNESLCWKLHSERFAEWIKAKIPSNSECHSSKLRWLAFGPRHTAQSYKGYVINGHRFHRDDVKRMTQNSGLTYEAFSMCRSSARDSRQTADMVVYYGVIKEIIMLDYHMFHVPLFKCSWANKGYGVKEEDGFTLVNLHMNQSSFLQDPYILPSQAKQVFYSREDDSSSWYVVMRAPPRGYHELETEEEFVSGIAMQQDEDLSDHESDDDNFCVREDCEGVLRPAVIEVRRSKRNQIVEEQDTGHEEIEEQPTDNQKNAEKEVAPDDSTNQDAENADNEVEPEEHFTGPENQNTAEKEVDLEEVDNQPEKVAEPEQTKQSEDKKRRIRGPTKMRKLAKEAMEKVTVDFSAIGEHSGPGSVTLSSFLGPLVREHVSVLVDDWRAVDCATKDTMWEEIKARFNLEEGWQRDCVMKQMGAIWRASKSRLVAKLRETKSSTQRLKLKPSNIQSLASWNNWVKSRTCTAFKVKSEQYRDLRKSQIPHTTSRKGMFRLSVEMKKKSLDPRKVTRSKVWLAGHTHSDGRPVKKEFADTIERIQTIDSQVDSTATENIREDAVNQVLGKDKYGRVRGMGRGISLSKVDYLNARDSHVQKLEASQAALMTKVEELQNQVSLLAGKKQSLGVDEQSDVSNTNKGLHCKILDWCSPESAVVAKGEVCSFEPKYMIGGIPLGPNAAAIIVNSVIIPEAYVWRPTTSVCSIAQAVGVKIPWPADRVVLDSDIDSPSQHETEVSDEGEMKCNIFDWNGTEIVAEGIMCSVDPTEKVNQIPLGPNAAIMKVHKVIDHEAFLWRPSAEMAVMGDAVNENIAWPLDKVKFLNASPDISQKESPGCNSTSKSTGNSQSPRKKCILFDCSGSGKIVAEGRVCSTDPNDRVHFVPLGPNATKVWVDVSKIGDAQVWRPNSEIQCVADAIGTTIAWPNDKLELV